MQREIMMFLQAQVKNKLANLSISLIHSSQLLWREKSNIRKREANGLRKGS